MYTHINTFTKTKTQHSRADMAKRHLYSQQCQHTAPAHYTSSGTKWLHTRGSPRAIWSAENAWTLSGVDADDHEFEFCLLLNATTK